MEEVTKTAVVPVTIEQQVESFISQVKNDILPSIDKPDTFIILLDTLSILCNRIKTKNTINTMIQNDKLQINFLADNNFNERTFQKFCEIINLSDIVTDELDDDLLMYFINLGFDQRMNIYLESNQFPVSAFSISMDQFDQALAFQINFLTLLE